MPSTSVFFTLQKCPKHFAMPVFYAKNLVFLCTQFIYFSSSKRKVPTNTCNRLGPSLVHFLSRKALPPQYWRGYSPPRMPRALPRRVVALVAWRRTRRRTRTRKRTRAHGDASSTRPTRDRAPRLRANTHVPARRELDSVAVVVCWVGAGRDGKGFCYCSSGAKHP